MFASPNQAFVFLVKFWQDSSSFSVSEMSQQPALMAASLITEKNLEKLLQHAYHNELKIHVTIFVTILWTCSNLVIILGILKWQQQQNKIV